MSRGGALPAQAPPLPGTPGAQAAWRLRLPACVAIGPGVAAFALVGTTLSFLLPSLPPQPLLAALLPPLLLLWWLHPRGRLPAALLAGFAWTALQGGLAMQQRLPEPLQGQDLSVEATVLGLPQAEGRRLRMDLRLDHVPEAPELAGRRVRIARYGEGPAMEPGSRWQLTLRLKRPRGLVNPGGFDFERFALERRVVATGYIRGTPVLLAAGGGVDLLRERLSSRIAALRGPQSSARYLQALAVADTRGLSDADWAMLRATGITHLIAISGLHVALVAGFGALLARLGYWLLPWLGLRLPLPQGAALAALVSAAGYTALAGFGLPTLRTLAMIAAALAAVLLRRGTGPWQALALALLVVLVLDPLAALGAGFWLSYLGVAWLVWCLPRSPLRGLRGMLRELGLAQWVMTLGLLPLGVWFFGQASLAGPVANLVAVPWVSFVVVPLTLLATLLHPVPTLASLPLALADHAMGALLWLLEWMATQPWALAWLPEPGPAALLLASLAAFWLLMPRGVPGRPLALLLLLPLLWPQRAVPEHGQVRLTVLDVGQGLSVLVQTSHHALLYDAGPAREGMDLGEAVVVPALQAIGVRRLNALVVSHGDNDHAGGSAAVIAAYAPARVLTGEPRRLGFGSHCTAGDGWQWDGVDFVLLHPPPHFPELGNESSCILRIDAAGRSVLLAGDVSEVIEERLVRQPQELAADVVLVPHHGSRSSSSAPFVAATAASLAIVSAAHRSHFGHPAAEVVQRYAGAGAHVANTADLGAIGITLDRDMPVARGLRQQRPRYWREH